MRDIYRADGLHGLYKGFLVSVIGAFVFNLVVVGSQNGLMKLGLRSKVLLGILRALANYYSAVVT